MSGAAWHAPCDSAEAAELRAQETEQAAVDARATRNAVEAQQRAQAAHETRCEGGWLGGIDADHPTPCLVCRPHLASRRPCWCCEATAAACEDGRATVPGRECCDACSHQPPSVRSDNGSSPYFTGAQR